MDCLQIFNSKDFGQIRTVEINGKLYFVANDVARALGYKRPADAVTAHCKGSVKHRCLTDGGEQELKVIPEGDIYRLTTRSKLPSAEKFESWVFDEVVPSIRTNGGYIVGQETLSDDELMAKAILVAQKKIAERDQLTSNARRYPKKYRFSLVDKMQNKTLEIYESLFEANRTDLKDYKRERLELARELKHIIDTHLDVSIKPEKSNNKVSIKALEKFNNLLDEESYK